MGIPGKTLIKSQEEKGCALCLMHVLHLVWNSDTSLCSLFKPKRGHNLLYHCGECCKERWSWAAGGNMDPWCHLYFSPELLVGWLKKKKKRKPLLIEFFILCSGVGNFWLMCRVPQRASDVTHSQEQLEYKRSQDSPFTFLFPLWLHSLLATE